MASNQSGVDSDLLLAGDNSELHSPLNGFVKKIKFTTTYNEINIGDTIILTTGHIDTNYQYIETDTTVILVTIRPSYTYEFDVNLRLTFIDQIFVGFNS
jgi:hypothetical protein